MEIRYREREEPSSIYNKKHEKTAIYVQKVTHQHGITLGNTCLSSG